MVTISIPLLSPSYIVDSLFYFKRDKKYEKKDFSISAVVPARNEEQNIKDCLISLKNQLYGLEKIVVIDDNSADRTPDIVKKFEDVKLVRNDVHKGKIESLLTGLKYVDSELTLILDADTILEKNFTDEIRTPFSDKKVAGACGTVFSKGSKNFTERARVPEYIFYQYFRKVSQNKRKALYTVAGCCAAFKTDVLKNYGIPKRTEVEDMDLTWLLQEGGYQVIYWPRAVAYTQEPQTFRALATQLGRWYRGMWQTLYLHGKEHARKNKRLLPTTWLQIFETLPFSFFYLSLPFVGYYSPAWAVGFISVDIASLLIPTLYHAKKLKLLRKVSRNLLEYYVLRGLNCSAAIYGFFKTSYEYLRGRREWSH